jgi:hypothetical protein
MTSYGFLPYRQDRVNKSLGCHMAVPVRYSLQRYLSSVVWVEGSHLLAWSLRVFTHIPQASISSVIVRALLVFVLVSAWFLLDGYGCSSWRS